MGGARGYSRSRSRSQGSTLTLTPTYSDRKVREFNMVH